MSDKMMRVSARGKDERAKAIASDNEGRLFIGSDHEVVKIKFDSSSYDVDTGLLHVENDEVYKSFVYNFALYRELDTYVRCGIRNGARIWFTLSLEDQQAVRAVRYYDWNTEGFVNQMEGQNDFILSYHPNAITVLSSHPDFYWLKNNTARVQMRLKPFNFDESGEVEVWLVGRY